MTESVDVPALIRRFDCGGTSFTDAELKILLKKNKGAYRRLLTRHSLSPEDFLSAWQSLYRTSPESIILAQKDTFVKAAIITVSQSPNEDKKTFWREMQAAGCDLRDVLVDRIEMASQIPAQSSDPDTLLALLEALAEKLFVPTGPVFRPYIFKYAVRCNPLMSFLLNSNYRDVFTKSAESYFCKIIDISVSRALLRQRKIVTPPKFTTTELILLETLSAHLSVAEMAGIFKHWHVAVTARKMDISESLMSESCQAIFMPLAEVLVADASVRSPDLMKVCNVAHAIRSEVVP